MSDARCDALAYACLVAIMAVGRLDPLALVPLADRPNLSCADAVVLSACVQMPSLPAIQVVEDRLGLPVLSAATATAHELLRRLGLEPRIESAGSLLRFPAFAPAGG